MKFVEVSKLIEKYPQLKEDDIKKIQAWFMTQPHLPKVTDAEVGLFLHAAGFSVEATKTRMDNYYTCRTKMDFAFKSRDIAADDMDIHHDVVTAVVLPEKTPEGYAVSFIKIQDPDHFNFTKFLKLTNFVCEAEVLEDGPIEGIVHVVDMNGARISHVALMNLNEMKQMIYYIQNCVAVRTKQFHFINPVPFMSQVLALIKPFLAADIIVEVHDNFDDIRKFIPAHIFPNDYNGGKAPPLKQVNDDYYKYLKSRREYFLDEERTRRVNEKLRTKKATALDEVFGLQGNFKKLDID